MIHNTFKQLNLVYSKVRDGAAIQTSRWEEFGFLISGAKDGFPIVWIHGTLGSYMPVPNLEAACEEKGLKVITISRAGFGGSTRKKGRPVVDVVADLQALNEHLGVERCFVGGWSGGDMLT
jgi:pimeloyl-ACP methyl ester carboxylesterase